MRQIGASREIRVGVRIRSTEGGGGCAITRAPPKADTLTFKVRRSLGNGSDRTRYKILGHSG